MINDYRINATGKIIFICRENIGRSQVAEALWEQNGFEVPSASAGLQVDRSGQEVGDCPEADILRVVMLNNHGIDIARRPRTSLDDFSKKSLGSAALLVVMAEPEVVPEDLTEMPNYYQWEMPDMKFTDYEQTEEIVHMISTGLKKVRDFLIPGTASQGSLRQLEPVYPSS